MCTWVELLLLFHEHAFAGTAVCANSYHSSWLTSPVKGSVYSSAAAEAFEHRCGACCITCQHSHDVGNMMPMLKVLYQVHPLLLCVHGCCACVKFAADTSQSMQLLQLQPVLQLRNLGLLTLNVIFICLFL